MDNGLNTFLESVNDTIKLTETETETETEVSEDTSIEKTPEQKKEEERDFIRKFTENYIDRMQNESFYLKEAYYQIKFSNPLFNNFGKSTRNNIEITTVDKFKSELQTNFPKAVDVEIYRSPNVYELHQLLHLRDVTKKITEPQLNRIKELEETIIPEENSKLTEHFLKIRTEMLEAFSKKDEPEKTVSESVDNPSDVVDVVS